MLTGLLGSALGYQRHNFSKLEQLQSRIQFASRIDQPAEGRQNTDFQTAQLHKNEKHWTTRGVVEGRDGGAATYNGPHLRYREYLDDLVCYVALTLTAATADEIDHIIHALNFPARPLFIGRKSCPPSSPVFMSVTEAPTALEALLKVPVTGGDSVYCQWEDKTDLEFLDQVSTVSLCDERDWANGQHVGTRMVYEAPVSAEHFAENR
jgi:CRISPR system Cascade subunit CasD